MEKSELTALDAVYVGIGFLLLIAGMGLMQSSWLGYGLMAAALGVLLYNVVRPRTE
jgi:hypothetical protein